MTDDALSVPEAAQRLGVTPNTVHAMLNRGDLALAYHKWQGRQRRTFVTRASVEAWLQRQQGQGGKDG